MRIFDPETSDNLTWDQDEAKRLDTENEEDRKASLERAREQEKKDPTPVKSGSQE